MPVTAFISAISRRARLRGLNIWQKESDIGIVRILKYLAALWTAVAVYSIFSLFFGAMGLSAQEQLLAERERLWTNQKNLALINNELENTTNSLLYDQDAIAVHARRLGYGHDDERFIRIVGLGGIKNPNTAAGQAFFAATPDYIPDIIIKIIAICAGLTVFALLFIIDLLRSHDLD